MTSDGELLRRVAEDVLGLETRANPNYETTWQVREQDGVWRDPGPWADERLSTGRILDALEERGFCMKYESDGYPGHFGPRSGHAWSIRVPGELGPARGKSDESRLEALCRAALEAVEEA